MAIARRLYPILLGEKGELDPVEVDNTVRNAWTGIFALQEDVTAMQEKVAGAIRRGEIANDDEDASVSKVNTATIRTIVTNSTASFAVTGAKLVSPLANRLPFINTALELDGGTLAPEYNPSTKALTIRGTLNISGVSTLTGAVNALSTLTVTGAGIFSSTLAVTGAVTIQGQTVIDLTNSEALMVRKDGDSGDVFQVDTDTLNVNVWNATFNLVGSANLVIARPGGHGLGTGGATNIGFHFAGQLLGPDPQTIRIQSQLKPNVNSGAHALVIATVLYVEQASGTHAIFNGILLGAANVIGGGASVTNTAQLHIDGIINAIGATQYAIWVEVGASRFEDTVSIESTLTVTGNVEFDSDLNHDGSNIGFFGTAPAAQAAAYTRNATIVEDRTLLASASATTINNNNVLAALIADLQSYGLIQ